MAIQVKGQTYYWVDTVCVDEVIYDIYQNDNDEVIYKPIDTLW